MTRIALLLSLLVLNALPLACAGAFAQTRAWLDREEVVLGETATLNIETDARVGEVDYGPLAAQFDIAGQSVRRSFESVGGRTRARSLFAVGLRPRGAGDFTVPPLQVGGERTTPLRLRVSAAPVRSAAAGADVFVEADVDVPRPYVQQAVGLVVRLHYAVPLLSGQLDQDPVAGASLQRVGEDLQYQRDIGGRRYNVVERRYLLLPERSGTLAVPGARFNGMAVAGVFDDLFGGSRAPLSAAAPELRLEVRSIPASAPQPWLPLRDLRLRYVAPPARARASEAVMLEVEAVADGASASQLPPLLVAEGPGMQVFPEAPLADERFVEGRPVTTLRRRIAIVPSRAGMLSVPGPSIEWWDAVNGVARTTALPELRLEVAPGDAAADVREQAPDVAIDESADAPARPWARARAWPWLAAMLVLGLPLAWWWRWARRRERSASKSKPPSLAAALRSGDAESIARALSREAGLGQVDLERVAARLADPAQAGALAAWQAARWGKGDAADALAALRQAFARGARWRGTDKKAKSLLPPLYPE